MRTLHRMVALTILAGLAGCATPVTHHPVVAADMGAASSSIDMEASLARPGVVGFQRIAFARWTGGRGGFIDRDDPRSDAIPKGDEQAIIYAYVIDHPTRGRYLIDAGVSRALEPRLNPLMRKGIADLSVTVGQSTADLLRGQTPPRAVFLTHLHFDHVGGVIDLDAATPIYVGPGEAQERNRVNGLLGHPIDAILRGRSPLREWRFAADPSGRFDGVLDIFGDGSVWAIRAPGHTPGSTAYLVNAVEGPKLVIGDAAHTRLGWEAGLPQPLNGDAAIDATNSVERLRRFASDHPQVEVFLGHQSRTGQAEAPWP